MEKVPVHTKSPSEATHDFKFTFQNVVYNVPKLLDGSFFLIKVTSTTEAAVEVEAI